VASPGPEALLEPVSAAPAPLPQALCAAWLVDVPWSRPLPCGAACATDEV
jgi:hypothetical protein